MWLARGRIAARIGLGVWIVGLAFAARATPRSYTAQLEILAGSFPTVTATAGGTLDMADDGSFTLPATVLEVAQVKTSPQTPSQVFSKATFDFHNGTGSFAGPTHPGGPMPLIGKVKLFAKAPFAFPPTSLPLTQGFSGGTAVVMASNAMTVATVELKGTGGWRTGTVRQAGSTAYGSIVGPRTNLGTDMRTVMGLGSMSLVIPVSFRLSLNHQFQELQPVTGILSIQFAPEPGHLALGIASVASLALLGAGRMRARRRADAVLPLFRESAYPAAGLVGEKP